MKHVMLKLAGALLVGTCAVAMAQSAAPDRPGAAQAQSSANALPAGANVVGSGPIVMPPVPRPAGAGPHHRLPGRGRERLPVRRLAHPVAGPADGPGGRPARPAQHARRPGQH